MGIKLIVEQTAAASPTIPIRWCVDRTTLDDLQEKGIRHPFILIVVRNHDNHRETRQLVPMHDLAAFVSFYSPGKNDVHAILVHTHRGSEADRTPRSAEKYVWGRFMGWHSSYDYDVLNPVDGTPYDYVTNNFETCTLTVTVPPELFASKPAGWERKWVNRWFHSAPVNQCAFRRRRLVAYTIQPPVVLTWLTLNYLAYGIGAFVQVLTGHFGLNWEKFHPAKIADPSEELTYVAGKGRTGHFAKKPWLLPLTPIIPLGAAGMTYLVQALHGLPANPWLPLIVAIGTVLGLWVAAGIIIAIMALVVLFFVGLKRLGTALVRKNGPVNQPIAKPKVIARRPTFVAPTTPPLYMTRSSVLSCDQIGPSPMSIPKEYQTLHYRIEAIKAKVCKPFAR